MLSKGGPAGSQSAANVSSTQAQRSPRTAAASNQRSRSWWHADLSPILRTTSSLSPRHKRHSSLASSLSLDEVANSPVPESDNRSSPQVLPSSARPPSFHVETTPPYPADQGSARVVFDDDMVLTGDNRRSQRGQAVEGGLAGWFSGSQTGPASLGKKPYMAEGATPSIQGRSTTFDSRIQRLDAALPTRLKKRSTVAGDASPKTASAGSTSRFSFIASSMSAFSKLTAQPAPAVLGPAEDDEILNLNVETALFPNGVPADGSTFSPAAFKNLQQNAFGLFAKMQAAYRQQNAMLRELKAEREAEKDELDEAVTRTRHLKMQLEDMARKAAEQEEAIQQLLMELATERRTRADERAAREKGLAAMARLPGVVPAPSEGSMISEDLGVDEEQRRLARRKWRRKSLTMQSVDGETDEESAPEDGSVFSRSRSPTIAASLFEAGGSTADGPTATAQPQQSTLHHSPAASRQTAAATGPKPRTTVQQMSTFQKLLKGISGETVKEDEVYDGPGCRNCKGQDSSVAWNTVSLLRDENKSLKQRVATLETAVESALDLVNGVGA